MRITNLNIANLREIEAAEFRFRPGFNLIVGVNGSATETTIRLLKERRAALISAAVTGQILLPSEAVR